MSKILVETTLRCGRNLPSPLDWNWVNLSAKNLWGPVLTSLYVPATLSSEYGMKYDKM